MKTVSCSIVCALVFAVSMLLSVPVAGPLPEFKFHGIVLEPTDYDWPRRNDFVSPYVIQATDYFSKPLGAYYMYTGPHDHCSECGVGLYYANSLFGPWKLHKQLIGNQQAAPCVFWVEEKKKLYMITHGPENHENHIYESENGIDFNHIKEMTDLQPQPHGYGKVFRYTIPGKNNTFIFVANDATRDGDNSGLSISNNMTDWQYVNRHMYPPYPPHMVPHSPFYFPYGGKHYMIFADFWTTRELWAYEVNADLTVKNYMGTVVPLEQGDPVYKERISYPFIYPQGDSLYLFASIGRHQGQRIALLIAHADNATFAVHENGTGESAHMRGSPDKRRLVIYRKPEPPSSVLFDSRGRMAGYSDWRMPAGCWLESAITAR